ncbi:MAG: MlaE family lipid ABC transporter permease subunit [Polyangia bacterium]
MTEPDPLRTSERTPAPDPQGQGQALDLPSLQRQVEQAPSGGRVILDLGAAPSLSGLEAASLLRLVMTGRERGVVVLLSNLQPGARLAFTGLSADLLGRSPGEEDDGLVLIEQVGNEAADAYKTGKNLLALIGDFFHFALVTPLRGKGIKWDRTFQQLERIGADAVPIVLFLSYLIGTVLALNGASQLRQFGAAIYIADLVGVAMTREMAPLITAIIVCGRSGSAITAELGTMVVSEEIDAMRTMALSPGRFLLVPRVLALLWAMPFLTLASNFAGVFGGYVVGVFLLELGSINYITETAEALLLKDLVTGLTKSLVFALLIGFTACYRGFHVRGGAEGVGTSTTASVVTSIILCIVANAVFTAIFYHWR